MPIVFRCSNCNAPLGFADDQAGRRYHCPRCNLAVVVPAASAADAEQIVAGEPPLWPSTPSLPPLALPDPARGPSTQPAPAEQVTERLGSSPAKLETSSRRPWEQDEVRSTLTWNNPQPEIALVQEPEAWRLVRLGLRLHYGGIIAVFFIALVSFGLSMCLLAYPFPFWDGMILHLYLIAVVGGVGLSLLIACVGQCLCCAVPSDSGVRGLAIGSAICLMIDAIAGVAVFFIPRLIFRRGMFLQGGEEGLSIVFLMMLLLLFGSLVAGHILFVVFLRQTARSFRSYTVAESAGSYLIVYAFFAASYVLQVAATAFVRWDFYGLFLCLGFAQLIVGLFLVVWYLRLVKLTRQTLDFWTQGA